MSASATWLLLVHQLPPRPAYLRAQVRRRLVQVGALPLKNSVYVLPDTPTCLEDFQWIAQEAVAAGGQAVVWRAELLGDPGDDALRSRFREAADERYAGLRSPLQQWLDAVRGGRSKSPPPDGSTLRRRLDEARRIDFFGSATGREVRTLMTAIERAGQRSRGRHATEDVKALAGLVWVTRRDPHIDRLATAWLIRRFVDPAARFRFVEPTGGATGTGERAFDMLGAHFTHDGDRCTFEVMRERLALSDTALGAIAEVVHDLDLKDGKFQRPEAAGLQRIVHGLAESHPDSSARVEIALPVFDALYASFGGRLTGPAAPPSRTGRTRARSSRS